MTNNKPAPPSDRNQLPADTASDRFFEAVDRTVSFAGPRLARHSFSKVSRHAIRLLGDAVTAFRSGSFGTAVFLAVTSMEEVAKAEMSIYRRGPADPKLRTRTDPLFSHSMKHMISIRPTTFMGRLREMLGDDACKRLQEDAQRGEFNHLREAALYSTLGEDETTTPDEIVGPERARETLLLALEVADDVLVGYNSETFVMGEQLSEWIGELAALAPKD
jgi:AbiV family abortive infection protein